MTCAGKTNMFMKKIGAGGLAALAAILILCLLLFSEKEENTRIKTEKEMRLERAIEKIEGAGEADVLVMEEGGNVVGVLIVAEGADDIAVRLRLQTAVQTLLNVDNDKISVVPMEGK